MNTTTIPYKRKHPFIKVEDSNYGLIKLSIASGDGDGDYPDCTLTIAGFKKYVTITLPHIIKPKATKVYPKQWDEETVKRLGRNWYYDYAKREYGFTMGGEGHVSVHYGIQTDDSSTEQRMGFFLPWTQWKFLRRTIYSYDGTFYANFPNGVRLGSKDWDKEYEATKVVPKTYFAFDDFDGERIYASCYIDEREWSKGDKWCSWLRFFTPNKIRKDMDIAFTSEVGKRKGSWKGGTLGHGIEMLPEETCVTAFMRYCKQENLQFVSHLKQFPQEVLDDIAEKEARYKKNVAECKQNTDIAAGQLIAN